VEDQPESRRSRTMLIAIFAGLTLFGGFIAAGSYFSDATPDWRKPAIVMGALALFLGGWCGLLSTRKRKGAGNDEQLGSGQ
jgi:hypothetical protein